MPIIKPRKKRLDVRTELTTKGRNLRVQENLQLEGSTESYTANNIEIATIKIGKSRKRVVVKTLDLSNPNFLIENMITIAENYGIRNIPNWVAMNYNAVISEFRDLGIELPKMKAIVDGNKVRIISQYFGNSKNRKLTKYFSLSKLSETEIEEYINVYSKLVNAKYPVTNDLLEVLLHRDGLVPLDIDIFVIQKMLRSRSTEEYIYGKIAGSFELKPRDKKNPRELKTKVAVWLKIITNIRDIRLRKMCERKLLESLEKLNEDRNTNIDDYSRHYTHTSI